MEIGLPQVVLYLYNVYLENKDSDNCAQLLEEEFNKIYGIKSLDDEHDCNIASMNSLNIHDANDMPSPKIGMLCLMNMIFLVPQVLMSKFIVIIACLLFMMITMMKVGLEMS
jgi:hypothetical protein